MPDVNLQINFGLDKKNKVVLLHIGQGYGNFGPFPLTIPECRKMADTLIEWALKVNEPDEVLPVPPVNIDSVPPILPIEGATNVNP